MAKHIIYIGDLNDIQEEYYYIFGESESYFCYHEGDSEDDYTIFATKISKSILVSDDNDIIL